MVRCILRIDLVVNKEEAKLTFKASDGVVVIASKNSLRFSFLRHVLEGSTRPLRDARLDATHTSLEVGKFHSGRDYANLPESS